MSASSRPKHDAIVVGAGPNGLAAAIVLARAGVSTTLYEARDTPGGGARTSALTAPDFRHDVCATVHPLALASPFLRELGLEGLGLQWIDPPAALAHVLDDGRAILLERSVRATAAQLGADGPAYIELMAPLCDSFERWIPMILGPLRVPDDPWLLARFGMKALRSMRGLAASRFGQEAAPALLAGIAAHAMVPLESAATASFALVLGAAGHAVGWPIARGGSQSIVDALVRVFREAGGELVLGRPIAHIDELPSARAYLFDVTPAQLLDIAPSRLPASYRRRLARFRYGPGVFKMDWALEGPIPWRDPACARAATVHLSGGLGAIADAEAAVHAGTVAERPFVLLVQPSLFDPSRAPEGMHTAWAYCHVPHGAAVDASRAIEAHVERFAPGFCARVIARSTRGPAELERYDANYIGGDINGGLADLRQLFFRPTMRRDPYATPAPDIFLCSASTPPGGGVHGMCGYWAARSALANVFGRRAEELRREDEARAAS